MDKASRKKERRRFQRFGVKPGTCVLYGKTSVPGRILNISPGGMCFCYIDDSCWINWVDEVDIIDEESEIFLRNIPFETVKDFLVNDTNSSLPRLIQRRIRFCDLSEEQRTNIKEFIRMNAV